MANLGLSLALGGCYYILQRPGSYLAGLLRPAAAPMLAVPPLVNNHLCDVLWAYALTMALYWALGRIKPALLVAALAEVAIEAAQLAPGLPGHFRFDIWDILFELVATVAACGVIILYRRKKNEKC